jgi:hypothetical protein
MEDKIHLDTVPKYLLCQKGYLLKAWHNKAYIFMVRERSEGFHWYIYVEKIGDRYSMQTTNRLLVYFDV